MNQKSCKIVLGNVEIFLLAISPSREIAEH